MFECRACGHDHYWRTGTTEAYRCTRSTGQRSDGDSCLCSAADYVPLDNLEYLEFKLKEKELEQSQR